MFRERSTLTRPVQYTRPAPALAASLLVGLCTIVIGLPGGFLWLIEWDIAPAIAQMNNAA
jgi:hypothetical protein